MNVRGVLWVSLMSVALLDRVHLFGIPWFTPLKILVPVIIFLLVTTSSRRFDPRPLGSLPFLAILLYLTWLVVVALAHQDSLGDGVVAQAFLLAITGMMIAILVTAEGDAAVHWMAWGIVVAGLIGGASVLVESMGIVNFKSWFPESEALAFRSFGLMGEPNFGAAKLCVAWPFAVYHLGRGSRARRTLAAVTVALLPIAVLLTGSRMGTLFLAAEISVVIAWFVRGRVRQARRAFAGIAVCALLLAPVLLASGIGRESVERANTLFEGFGSFQSDPSAQTRASLAWAAIAIASDAPLFGTGFNTFAGLAPRYGALIEKPAHNLYLETAAEAGVVALLLMLFVQTSTIMRLRTTGKSVNRDLGVVLLLACTVQFAELLFLSDPNPKLLWLLFVPLAMYGGEHANERRNRGNHYLESSG